MNSQQKVRKMLTGVLQPDNGVIDIDQARSRHPGVVQALTRYDRQLILYYDKAVAKYGLARLTPDGLRFICLWQDEKTGAALPVSMKILDAVRRWDLRPSRVGAPKNADEIARARDAADLKRAEKIDQEFDDDISHLTRANRRQLERILGQIR